ncbi:hypothetical protein B0H17DRAFT_1144096 [Mycena rosella]|uniref:F-box domain-containing protein n=1 Tax=Mycena rosella TaxID=1033263 RepID=A0AAD7CTU7_MYCRO|nr:hypothetical protein B0H17DRAFT_1144096 [Mycena rosella]
MVKVLPVARNHIMIQEIWEHIIGMLRGCTDALRACALVCRAFRFPAQSQLFQEISLARFKSVNAHIAASCWLACYLRRSPHLIPLIRRLLVQFHPRTLEQISPFALPQLRTIQFFPAHFTVLKSAIPPSWIESALDIIALPSLTEVVLNVLTFHDIDDMERLLRALGPNVKTLSIRFCGISDAVVPVSAPVPPRFRPQITDLAVVGSNRQSSSSVVGWLNSRRCPLNITQLTSIDITCSFCPDFAPILRASQSTITQLKCGDLISDAPTPGDLHDGLDLAMFPALVFLQAAPISTRGLAMLTRKLTEISPLNHIETLKLALHDLEGPLWLTAVEERLTSFDASASALLPALENVTVILCCVKPEAEDHWYPGPTAAGKCELVADLLSSLRAGRSFHVAPSAAATHIKLLPFFPPQSAHSALIATSLHSNFHRQEFFFLAITPLSVPTFVFPLLFMFPESLTYSHSRLLVPRANVYLLFSCRYLSLN